MSVCDFRPGTKFIHNDIKYRVLKQVDEENLRVEDAVTLETSTMNRIDLLGGMATETFRFDNVSEPKHIEKRKALPLDVGFFTKSEVDEAQRNHDTIAPLLAMGDLERGRKKLAMKIASEIKCHISRIYRLVQRYNDHGMMGMIAWDKLKGPKGQYKLSSEVKEIVGNVITDLCPDPTQLSVMRIYREILYFL